MKKALLKKSLTVGRALMLVGTISGVVSGCSSKEDLSDRPFIMACTGENGFAREKDLFSTHAPTSLSGVDLPDEAAFGQNSRGIISIYRNKGYLPHETALQGNTAIVPLSEFGASHLFANTGQTFLQSSNAFGGVSLHDTIGELRASHFYMDSEGNLNPINNFHIAKYSNGKVGTPTVRRTVAAVLPSNATYAVVHVEGAHTRAYHRLSNDEIAARIGQSGYWVLPLEDKYRYQPFRIDERHGVVGVDKPLGPYVGPDLVIADNDTPTIGPRKGFVNRLAAHRRAHSRVTTIDCLMQLGSTLKFEYIFDVEKGVNENGEYPARGHSPSYYDFGLNDYHFIGDEEALNALPKDPSKFKI